MYFRFAWLFILAGLILLPISARAEEKAPHLELKDRLSELQKAVGKDWSVTVLPDGYLLTYAQLVNFYPAFSANSKMDVFQRMGHGRMDHLRIKVVLGSCLTDKEKDDYNYMEQGDPSKDGLKNAPHFFLCDAKGGLAFGDGKPEVCVITNYSPYESVSSKQTQDAYDGTVDVVASLFHCIQPIIED